MGIVAACITLLAPLRQVRQLRTQLRDAGAGMRAHEYALGQCSVDLDAILGLQGLSLCSDGIQLVEDQDLRNI